MSDSFLIPRSSESINRFSDFRLPSPNTAETQQENPKSINSNDTDQVELSPQAIELSRTNPNGLKIPINPVGQVGGVVEPEPRDLSESNLNINEQVVVSEKIKSLLNGSIPDTPQNEVAGIEYSSALPSAVGAVTFANGLENSQDNELAIELDNELRGNAARATDLTSRLQSAETFNLTNDVSPLRTTEGTVEIEPQFRQDEETLPQEPTPLEVQSQEIERINEIFNNRNANSTANGNNNQEIKNEISPDAPRNEQPIQLQNVGSQLAQVIPPASIVSVIG
jgi:hypothetical protein